MRYALVTGASRGIGRAIAERLARDGYAVIINYRDNDAAAEQTLQSITEAGGHASLMKADVADADAMTKALNQWQESHPDEYIEVLVNNAGIRQDALLVWMEREQWSSVLDTTLNGFYNTTRALIQPMLIHRHGRIINMSSISGVNGIDGQTNYSAAKAALIGATKSLGREVASRKVTVNAVAPGFISTDMTVGLDEKELKKNIPAGRFGRVEEVAALVSFLASDEASYITGQVIAIAGGL
mgnify:CR=1 FL=1